MHKTNLFIIKINNINNYVCIFFYFAVLWRYNLLSYAYHTLNDERFTNS